MCSSQLTAGGPGFLRSRSSSLSSRSSSTTSSSAAGRSRSQRRIASCTRGRGRGWWTPAKNHLSAKRKTGPTENSVCLSSDASRARRRVGVSWASAGILAAGPVEAIVHPPCASCCELRTSFWSALGCVLRARVPAVVDPGEQAQHRRESEKPAKKAPGVTRPPPNQTNDHRDDPANQDQPGDLQKEARTESLVVARRREGAVLRSCHLRASMPFAGG